MFNLLIPLSVSSTKKAAPVKRKALHIEPAKQDAKPDPEKAAKAKLQTVLDSDGEIDAEAVGDQSSMSSYAASKHDNDENPVANLDVKPAAKVSTDERFMNMMTTDLIQMSSEMSQLELSTTKLETNLSSLSLTKSNGINHLGFFENENQQKVGNPQRQQQSTLPSPNEPRRVTLELKREAFESNIDIPSTSQTVPFLPLLHSLSRQISNDDQMHASSSSSDGHNNNLRLTSLCAYDLFQMMCDQGWATRSSIPLDCLTVLHSLKPGGNSGTLGLRYNENTLRELDEAARNVGE